MPVQLNHTIVHARDSLASATFLADMLGLSAPVRFGPFHGVALDNGVTLDFLTHDGDMQVEHYAFLVSEDDFDVIFQRIAETTRTATTSESHAPVRERRLREPGSRWAHKSAPRPRRGAGIKRGRRS